MNKLVVLVAVIAAVGGSPVETELKSRPASVCSGIKLAPEVNITWITKSEIWYFPILSRNEMQLTKGIFLSAEESAAMSDDVAASKVCLLVNWGNGDLFGFGKKFAGVNDFHFNSLRPGLIDWEQNGKYGATIYVVKTDNSSYAVGVQDLPDGSRTGFVMTPEPDMANFSSEQVLEWKKILVDYGFLEKDLINTPTKCASDFWESMKQKSGKKE